MLMLDPALLDLLVSVRSFTRSEFAIPTPDLGHPGASTSLQSHTMSDSAMSVMGTSRVESFLLASDFALLESPTPARGHAQLELGPLVLDFAFMGFLVFVHSWA